MNLSLRTLSMTLALSGALWMAGAASAAAAPLHITVLGGMSVSKLRDTPDPIGIYESLKGLSAGVGLAWALGPNLELQPQLLYVEKGVSLGEATETDNAGNTLGTFEALHVTSALEVPVLVRFEFPTGGRIHPVIAAGPFASFELSEKMKLTGSQESSNDEDTLKGTDIGIAFGGGLEIDAGPGRWLIEARYDHGTVELNPDGSHSSAWLLMTGYRF
jgi:outer membrane protein with beta-barrel domain